MKLQIKNSANRFGLIFLVLVAALFWNAGCATPNPLAGWKPALQNPNQAIINDYQNYIQKLPSEEKKYAYPNHFFEDATGQHAVQIEIPLNGTWREHLLIYDKDNIRIKTITYSNGGYRS